MTFAGRLAACAGTNEQGLLARCVELQIKSDVCHLQCHLHSSLAEVDFHVRATRRIRWCLCCTQGRYCSTTQKRMCSSNSVDEKTFVLGPSFAVEGRNCQGCSRFGAECTGGHHPIDFCLGTKLEAGMASCCMWHVSVSATLDPKVKSSMA